MRVAIVGLPAAGKSTLFGALTGQNVKTGAAAFGEGPRLATVEVPDPRVNVLAAMYGPRKVTRAGVEFLDGAAAPDRKPGAGLLQDARSADALVHVVRLFASAAVPRETPLNPVGDLREMEAELILADLGLVETRLERLEKQARGKPRSAAGTDLEAEVLGRIRAHLEAELPLKAMALAPPDRDAVRHLEFLSNKPVVVVPNIGEEDLGGTGPESLARLCEWASRSDTPVVPICATVEMEIAQLGREEEGEFLAAMGLSEPGRARLIRIVYHLLGQVSFFTVGEDEVKAWTISRGDTALTAAGKIHSDLARGFIRAEVIPYEALADAGDPAAARSRGQFRLEQKPYVVQDGDILNIRFSV